MHRPSTHNDPKDVTERAVVRYLLDLLDADISDATRRLVEDRLRRRGITPTRPHPT